MARSDPNPMPRFDSIHDLIEFFDTHDMGDYWDQMPEAHFDVDLRGKSRLVAIDEGILSRITEIARSQHVSVENLINSWLQEKVAGVR
jgi:hypothetical protein